MFLAAGEVLQRGAEALVLERAHVHLQTLASELHAGLVDAAPQHLVRLRIRGHAIHRRHGIRSRHQDVEIADRLLTPPKTARGRYTFDAGQIGQRRRDLRRRVVGEAEQESPAALLILRNAAQHLLLELRPHARQRAQLLLAAQSLQLVHRLQLKMLEQQRDTFRTQPLYLQKLQRRRRKLRQQLVAFVERPALADLLQHRGQTLADAGHIGHLARRVCKDVFYALGIPFDRRRAVAIAADAKAVLAGDLHQIAGFRQDAREVSVFQALSVLAGRYVRTASDRPGRRRPRRALSAAAASARNPLRP